MPELEWLAVNKNSKRKVNYRRTFFPKIPTYNNIMYYNSLVKLLLAVILIFIIFISYHFVTFNHHKTKIKTVTKYKDIVAENLVFLGDSITDFYDLDKFYPDHNVVNSGINGNVSDDILNDMYNRVYKYNPSKVFLLIGTNQLMNDDDEKIVNDIKTILIKIMDVCPQTKIYVESIYPVNKDLDEFMVKTRDNDRIVALNKKIKKMTKEQKNTQYINIYDDLLKDNKLNSDYSDDGLHLNDSGYQVVTDIIKKYL